jgi:hypothetical protein
VVTSEIRKDRETGEVRKEERKKKHHPSLLNMHPLEAFNLFKQ